MFIHKSGSARPGAHLHSFFSMINTLPMALARLLKFERSGVGVADVVKAPVLLVEIGSDPVRVPVRAPTKNGHWDVPLHKVCPNDPAGPQWKNSECLKS